MRRRRFVTRLVFALALAVAVATAPAARGATPADRAASRAYLRDAHIELVGVQANAARERAAELTFVAHVRATCPRVEIDEPARTAAQQRIEQALTNETVADLVVVAEAPAHRATATFIARLSRLHWTNTSVEQAAGRLERQTRRFFALAPSHLCADIRFSAAHRWRRLAPAARRFAAAFAATQKPPSPTAAGLGELMKPYLGPTGRLALDRLATLQSTTAKRLGRLLSNELNVVFAALD